jgi:hypothetical protein
MSTNLGTVQAEDDENDDEDGLGGEDEEEEDDEEKRRVVVFVVVVVVAVVDAAKKDGDRRRTAACCWTTNAPHKSLGRAAVASSCIENITLMRCNNEKANNPEFLVLAMLGRSVNAI